MAAKSVKQPVKSAAKPVAEKRADAANPLATPIMAETVAPIEDVLVAQEPVEEPVLAPASIAEPIIAELTPLIVEGPNTMTDTMTKIQETAKNFTAEASERANAMFTDLNSRAQDAMAKGTKSVEDMVEFSKGNFEAAVTSARVAAKGAGEIATYTADYGRKAIEDANATVKEFAAVKTPAEFFQLQQDVAKKQLDAVVAETSKFTENYLKLLGEIAQPLQNRYAMAVEKVKASVAA